VSSIYPRYIPSPQYQHPACNPVTDFAATRSDPASSLSSLAVSRVAQPPESARVLAIQPRPWRAYLPNIADSEAPNESARVLESEDLDSPLESSLSSLNSPLDSPLGQSTCPSTSTRPSSPSTDSPLAQSASLAQSGAHVQHPEYLPCISVTGIFDCQQAYSKQRGPLLVCAYSTASKDAMLLTTH
jgi:hypothetical protein